MSLLHEINRRMNGYVGCPKPGALGECAAVHPYTKHEPNGTQVAHLYLWQDEFNDSEAVAQWFKGAGCTAVWISHTLYSDANDDRDGQCGGGGARHWMVTFMPPQEERALKPGPVVRAVSLAIKRDEDIWIGFLICSGEARANGSTLFEAHARNRASEHRDDSALSIFYGPNGRGEIEPCGQAFASELWHQVVKVEGVHV